MLFRSTVLVPAGLTCRVWFDLCAPDLYSKIMVPAFRIHELIADLLTPGSRISPHAKELRILGSIPWRDLLPLFKLLPHVHRLNIYRHQRSDDTDATEYHPTLPRVISGITATSRAMLALTTVHLSGQRFSSPVDVLRLLAFFPLVQKADLYCCVIGRGPEHLSDTPSTHLSHVSVINSCRDLAVHATTRSFLPQLWQLPHPASDAKVGPYPGLHFEDVKSICDILRCVDTTAAFKDMR